MSMNGHHTEVNLTETTFELPYLTLHATVTQHTRQQPKLVKICEYYFSIYQSVLEMI